MTSESIFCNRITNIWNSLIIDIVTASTLNSFKTDLTSTGCNRILIIGNLNYQELEVEDYIQYIFVS